MGKVVRLGKDEEFQKKGALGQVADALNPVSREFSLLVPRKMIRPRV